MELEITMLSEIRQPEKLDTSERRKGIRKEHRRVNMMEILCTHV
jgi:hypothetical protein